MLGGGWEMRMFWISLEIIRVSLRFSFRLSRFLLEDDEDFNEVSNNHVFIHSYFNLNKSICLLMFALQLSYFSPIHLKKLRNYSKIIPLKETLQKPAINPFNIT